MGTMHDKNTEFTFLLYIIPSKPKVATDEMDRHHTVPLNPFRTNSEIICICHIHWTYTKYTHFQFVPNFCTIMQNTLMLTYYEHVHFGVCSEKRQNLHTKLNDKNNETSKQNNYIWKRI